MTAEGFLHRLDSVRQIGTDKYLALCPAHDDRKPSLSIREGDRGILIRCWTGCSLESICSALGIQVADLFYETQRKTQRQFSREVGVPPKPFRLKWRGHAHQILWFSEELFLRGERVLSTAKGIDPSNLTEEEFDNALGAIHNAHCDLEESERLADLAVNLRDFGIQEEKTAHAARRSAA